VPDTVAKAQAEQPVRKVSAKQSKKPAGKKKTVVAKKDDAKKTAVAKKDDAKKTAVASKDGGRKTAVAKKEGRVRQSFAAARDGHKS
jgi:hypothetical protein